MFLRQMWCRNNFLIIRHCLRCVLTRWPGPLPDLPEQVGLLSPTMRRTGCQRNVTTSARRNTQIAKSPSHQRTKQHATTTVIGGALAWYSKFILHFILLSSMFHKQMWCRNNNFLIICHCLRCVTRRWPGPLLDLHVQGTYVRELSPTMRRTVCQRNVTTSARSITQIVLGSKTNQKTPISSNWEPNCLPLTFALT